MDGQVGQTLTISYLRKLCKKNNFMLRMRGHVDYASKSINIFLPIQKFTLRTCNNMTKDVFK